MPPALTDGDEVADDVTGAEVLNEARRMRDDFLRAMDDDFNTAGAIAALFEALPVINRFMDERHLDEGKASVEDVQVFETFAATLRALGALLGVFEKPVCEPGLDEETLAKVRKIAEDMGEAPDAGAAGEDVIETLIERRSAARAAKDFNAADDIRDRLLDASIVLEDRPGGTTWTRAT